ncbi:hypothetical protein [[Eubacterium] hominis]
MIVPNRSTIPNMPFDAIVDVLAYIGKNELEIIDQIYFLCCKIVERFI